MDAADTRASPEKEEVICMRSITVQRLAEFTEQDYEFTFGITRKEFAQMLEALNAAYCKEHRRRPHFTKITMQDKLVLTLLYRREYRSMENIAAEYGCLPRYHCGQYPLGGARTAERKSAAEQRDLRI